MREISIEELKVLQVDILAAVHRFCTENNISYGLAYGTLIGAIRHHGYIPWDEDIDIMMPRPDYNKFLQLFNGKVENLMVMAPEINPNYYAPYANVFDKRTLLIESGVSHRGTQLGVKIDIFPIDGVPDDEREYRLIMDKLLWYNNILKVKRRKIGIYNGFRLKLKHLLSLLKSSIYRYSTIQKRIIACSQRYNKSPNYVDHLSFPVYPYKRFPYKDIISFIPMQFENHTFMCPVGYDDYLRTLYGDYMQLPPEEKRIAHHGFKAYWK